MNSADARRAFELSDRIAILQRIVSVIDQGASIRRMTLDNPIAGTVEVPTEELTYPPQMMLAIRRQEIALWNQAAQELTKLGVNDIPQPPPEPPELPGPQPPLFDPIEPQEPEEQSAPQAGEPTSEAIGKRAQEIYRQRQARGLPGDAQQDWAQAARELGLEREGRK